MDGWVTIGTKLDTKSFDAQIKETEDYLNKLESSYEKALNPPKGFVRNEEQLRKMQIEIEKTSNKLIDLRKRQQGLGQITVNDIGESLNDINKGTANIIKKVGKWALAIFSVRSVYMFIRNSVSALTQYNEQLATDLEYLQYSMAIALKPIIEVIVHLMYNLVAGINIIAKQLFNIDLLSNATAENFNKARNNANKLRKTLAGFDEMNVLNDDGTSGILNPSIDFEKAEKETKKFTSKVFNWWEDLGKDIEEILSDPEGILMAFDDWTVAIWGVTKTFQGLYEFIDGIIKFIVGLFQFLVASFTEDTELMENAVDNMSQGIYLILKGLLDFIIGIFVSIVGAITGILTPIIDIIKEIVIKPILGFFKELFEGIIDAGKNFGTSLKNIFTVPINFAKDIGNAFSKLFKGDIPGFLKGMKTAFKNAFDGLVQIVKAPLNLIIDMLNAVINGLNKIKIDIPKWFPGDLSGKSFGVNIKKIPRLSVGGIVNMPGRGVPIGGAIAGEVSKEGVIPLTDSQAMMELGQTIGKYININATVPVYVGNRQIAREIRKINANSDFATNN